jgi:anti-sigma factor RsiW
MSDCSQFTPLLQGLVDEELDAANIVRIESHVAACRNCDRELSRLVQVRSMVRENVPRYRAPDSLRLRIEQSLETRPPERRIARLPRWTMPALSGALAASLAMALILPVQTQPAIEQRVVESHIRSLLPDHLTDVRTTNQHIVRPWFNGKIDFSPPVPELAASGFPLVGGRLDYVGGKVVPALVYRRNLHTINVFVWPGPNEADKIVRKDGYTVVEWSDGGLRFVAVSDVGAGDLQLFRAAFRAISARD